MKEKDLRNVVPLVTSLQETADELREEVPVMFQQRFFQLLTNKHTQSHREQRSAIFTGFYKPHFLPSYESISGLTTGVVPFLQEKCFTSIKY